MTQNPLHVVKFGGTSVADAVQIRKVFNIVRDHPARRVVVVSAPGKRFPEDVKVTDHLIKLAGIALAGGDPGAEIRALTDRFAEMGRDLGLPASIAAGIEDDLRARVASDRTDAARFTDLLKAAGEDLNARLIAAAFTAMGLPARYVCPCEAGLLLDGEAGNAVVAPESYAQLARSLGGATDVVIFPGFFGRARDGSVVTFPRGGSDITGAILAAALKADLYENFTDVDSVFAVDPRIVPGARGIGLMTYREMRELSYAGFSVFHDEAILPAVQAHIPICIKNTNRPEAPGTRIAPERPYKAGGVVGVASAEGFCTLYVDKYLMNREIGFGRRLLQIIEDEGLSYEHCPSGIDSTSVILREGPLTAEKRDRILRRIREELKADDAEFEGGLALLMIVGEGMRYTVGMAARAAGALASAGVNIEMLDQGSSEISMIFGVKAVDRKRAVKALYEEFFKKEEAPGVASGAGA